MKTRILFLWLVLLLNPGALCAEEVYRSDFSKGMSEKIWTNRKSHQFVPGGETVLGVFGDQGFVRMDLTELPDHKLVRLRFDLLLYGGFDGNRGENQADIFSIQNADGPMLWNGSICVLPLVKQGRQSFPDEWPQGDHPAQTGRVPDGLEKEVEAQRYHFDIRFPHDSKELGIILRCGVNINGERWSFSNFIVDALPEFETLPAAGDEFENLWSEFGGEDPIVANRAVWRFIAAGEAGLKAIGLRTAEQIGGLSKKEQALLEKKFKEGLAGLSNEEFVKRVGAAKVLAELDPAALKLVDAAIANVATAAEARARLKPIRKKLAAKLGDKKSQTSLIAARIQHVQRVLNPERRGWRVSSSKKRKSLGWDHESSVIDSFVPPISPMFHSPRFCWWPEKDGDGWLRLDFPERRKVSAFSVFWFWDDFGVNPPASWTLEYLGADENTWRAVTNPSDYEVKGDVFNEVRFDEVETSALRLVVTFNGKKSAGIHEIRLK